MNWETIKLAAAIAAVAAWSWVCYHAGGNSGRTAVEALRAAQSQAVAKAVLAQRASGEAELERVNAILKGYEDALLHPVDLHIGSRVLIAACGVGSPVPKAAPDPGRTGDPAGITGSDPRLGPAIDRVVQAGKRDASKVTALQQAWPQ